ncbi:DUF4199 domain-containing protein [Daejeonella sp.]|uniref:DUF4199 domain-containing protein n=1 Tax=Daejeonella sp. TaxID=2805397 RepID=UPI0030C22F40
MELSLENLNKAAANNGLIIGILSAILGIVIFYIAPSLFGSMWFSIGNLVFFLVLYIFFTIDLRKKIGGYWNFKQAFTGIFIMAFVAGLLLTVVNYLFYQFVEPDGFAKISGFIEQGATKTFESMGMDEDQIEKAVSEQLKSMKKQFDPTPMDMLTNFGIGLVVEVIMSLIFAAIFKKEAPIFAPVEDDVD